MCCKEVLEMEGIPEPRMRYRTAMQRLYYCKHFFPFEEKMSAKFLNGPTLPCPSVRRKKYHANLIHALSLLTFNVEVNFELLSF